MPFVNLVVALAAAAWVAPFTLLDYVMAAAPDLAAYRQWVLVVLIAAVVLIGAYFGSTLSARLPRPGFISAGATFLFAAIGAIAAGLAFAPAAATSEVFNHLSTFAPVAAAIGGFFLAADRRG